MTETMTSFAGHASVRRSARGFVTNGEFLLAMKSDLADWLSVVNDVSRWNSALPPKTTFFQTNIEADTLIDTLSNGYSLCCLADGIEKWLHLINDDHPAPNLLHGRKNAAKKTFFARDNVCKFIHWCRSKGIDKQGVVFETDDLVQSKNELHVVKCLLDVARYVAGIMSMKELSQPSDHEVSSFPLPKLIEWEREIDLMERSNLAPSPPASTDRESCTSPDSNSSGIYSSGSYSLPQTPIMPITAANASYSRIPRLTDSEKPSPPRHRSKPAPKCHRTRKATTIFEQEKLNDEVSKRY